MAEATTPSQATKIKGKDLMIFVTNGSTTKALALCTNTTISLSAETNEYKTKDDTSASKPEVDSISWEATSENFYSVEAGLDAQYTSKELISLMLNKTKVQVAFGQTSASGTDVEVPTGGWQEQSSGFLMTGYGYITSCEVSASTSERATCNLTITGVGKIQVTGV